MELKRPIQTSIFGFSTSSGNFSNTKISATIGQGDDATTIVILDESADSTKKTTIIPDITPVTLLSVTLEFYTEDECSVSALIISKSQQRIARIQGLKPDGSVADFQATQSGNFKVSVEEFENTISTNSNTQMKVTNYTAKGIEGVKDSRYSGYISTGTNGTILSTGTISNVPTIITDYYFYVQGGNAQVGFSGKSGIIDIYDLVPFNRESVAIPLLNNTVTLKTLTPGATFTFGINGGNQ